MTACQTTSSGQLNDNKLDVKELANFTGVLIREDIGVVLSFIKNKQLVYRNCFDAITQTYVSLSYLPDFIGDNGRSLGNNEKTVHGLNMNCV